MKQSRLWGGALLLTGALPTLVVVACGAASTKPAETKTTTPTEPTTPPEPTPTEPTSPAPTPAPAPTTSAASNVASEEEAINAIINPSDQPLLAAINAAITRQSEALVTAATLGAIKPQAFTQWKIEIFAGVPDVIAEINGVLADTLFAIMKQVWNLPATTSAGDLLGLLEAAGYAFDDYAALAPFFASIVTNYDRAGKSFLASWTNFVHFSQLLIDPSNNYQYFKKVVSASNALGEERFVKLNALIKETYPLARDILALAPAPLFVRQLTGLADAGASRLAQTYYNMLSAAYPSADDAALKNQILATTPRALITQLGLRAQTGIAPNVLGLSPQAKELALFKTWPKSSLLGALLWKIFVASVEDAWGVDFGSDTHLEAKDYLTHALFGFTEAELAEGALTSADTSLLATKLQKLFEINNEALDSWSALSDKVVALFAAIDHHANLVTRLTTVFEVTLATLASVDQLLSAPEGALSGITWSDDVQKLPIKGVGGRSLINLYRPFADRSGVTFAVANDDVFLVPGTYRGRLWTGTKKEGHAIDVPDKPLALASSATQKPWRGIWGESVLEWDDNDSLYVLFDADDQDGISVANFTNNFFVVDTGVITDKADGIIRQYYAAQGNFYEPLGRTWEQWIGFKDGQSNLSISQENASPLDFDAALAKIKTRVDATTYAGIVNYYQRVSRVFKPLFFPRGLFTYQQVATNAMRVTFHNRGEDKVGVKAAGFALTNQINSEPTTPVKQIYSTFAFGEWAFASYETGKYDFKLAKFV